MRRLAELVRGVARALRFGRKVYRPSSEDVAAMLQGGYYDERGG